jgi:tetratricopeptide (TPR) repeat protein
MRSKTVKRLAILIVVFAFIGGGAYSLWRFQVGKMAQGVVEQAEKAMEEKRYAAALDLYQQHLLVVPDDQAVQLKYANVLLELQPTPKNQQTAMAIYNEILRRDPGREDVRRRAAELAVNMSGGMFEAARGHLAILLKSANEDGHLEYLMGRCYEEDKDKDPDAAANYYRAAIEHRTPERIEASQRLAALIRENEKLGKPEDADQVIDDMVKADPGNYRVYLERGHYRHRFNLEGAAADFQRSLKLARDQAEKSPELARDQAETYVELARLAERGTVPVEVRRILDEHRPFTFLLPAAIDVAREILDRGLEEAPRSAALYQARAELERKAGQFDRMVELVERGVKVMPDQPVLRWQLAMMLAAHGDTGKLLLHIEELKNLEVNKVFTDYLTAHYCVNNKEFERAKQILTSIEASVAQIPVLKAQVNVLLARCYGQLHQPEQQWEANRRAFIANPKDMVAQAGWLDGLINRLVSRGEIDEAIKEYRRQLESAPQLDRKRLVHLMLIQNRQRPPAQRNWREVEALIDEIVEAAPNSVEPLVLRALLHADQDQHAKAWEVLEAARSRFPEAVEPWTAEAELLSRQKKFDAALDRLDAARKQLGGDRIELRLARAMIWVARGAPRDEVVEALNGLAKDLEPFPKEKRRGLLVALAGELAVRQDVKDAEEIWLRLVDDDPDDVYPHFQLFEVARQAADKAETGKQAEANAKVEARIRAIERIDPTSSRLYRATYLTSQAGRSKDEDERNRLRTEARALLAELKTRRDEWELIPLAQAALEEQELPQVELIESRKRDKQEALITLYLHAIELGSRNPFAVRRTIELLFTTGRSNEALQLFSRMPAATQLGGDLMQMVAQVASSQNYQQAEEIMRKAEEIARKAVAARPGSFQERIWLVNILMVGKRTDEAEAELRRGIEQAEGEPDRWLTLVDFLAKGRQFEKAEQALRDAAKKLPQAPLALARCCELMGLANDGPKTRAQAKKWYDEARQWFDKALAARKDPKDASVLRRFVQFLHHADPAEAEKQLKEVLRGGAGAEDAVTIAWARRYLAVMYIADNPRRPAEALALFDSAGLQGADAEPEDKRVRANVLVAQGTSKHRREAIAILESLVNEKLATPEDQRLLAQVEEAEGDWPKSRDQYRKLIERTNSSSDPDSRKRQATYLAEFASRLLQPHQPGEDEDEAKAKDLVEAQEQIEKLKRIQPDPMVTLSLEVALFAARKDFEGAVALIRSDAERLNRNPMALAQLGLMAEKIDQFELAEEIFRKSASDPAAPFNPNKVVLIQFLGRRGRLPEVLKLCESLRKNAADRANVDVLSIEIFSNPSVPALEGQINRVIGWLEEEIRNGQQAMIYQFGLGNLYERLGQDRKAEDQYRAIVNSDNDRDGVAANNLAWLMAVNDNPKWNEALDLINRALERKERNPDYLDTRGVVFLAAGNGQRAIEDFKAAIQMQPTASKYFHLTRAYLIKKDKANAKRSLEAAKTRGLPNGLHPREMNKYKKVLDELGMR